MIDLADVATRLGPPERAALILDVDGTLAPIVARPELARVLPEATAELPRLVGSYGLVAVVSGRPTEEVAALVGVAGIRYEGLYGLGAAPQVGPEVVRLVERETERIGGAWVERKGSSLTVHVRQSADPEAAEALLRPSLSSIARDAGMELVTGKRTLELAPVGPRKGGAVERLVREAGVSAALFAGDDLPDLEAFEALDRLSAEGLTTVKVAVRGPETPASLEAAGDLIVEGPGGISDLLRTL